MKLRVNMAISVIAAASLSACAVYTDPSWRGPLTKGNQQAKVIQKCTSDPGGNSCKVIFKDQSGYEVNADEISNSIDNYLQKIKPFEKWVLAAESQRKYSRFTSGFPFKLYLLTISPTIVMAVPTSPTDQNGCNGQYLRDGYISSELLLPVCFRYLELPKIAQDSFWFSPEYPTGIHYLPNERDNIIIRIKDSSVELTKSGSQWKISR